MKTLIETKTAGAILIESIFLGDKKWDIDKKINMPSNYNNHKVIVKHDKKSFSFDFWGSIAEPRIKNDQENVFAFYCVLSDGIGSIDGFDNFCSEFGYDQDSRMAHKTYKACKKSLNKLERVFNCDLYNLINEIQETYNC